MVGLDSLNAGLDLLNAGQLASQPGGYLIKARGKRRKGRGHAAMETDEQQPLAAPESDQSRLHKPRGDVVV
jgi:hypothetical protein